MKQAKQQNDLLQEKLEDLQKKCKKTCFDVKDSSLNFIFTLIFPFIGSLLLIILFMLLSAFSGYDYKEFVKTEFVKVIELIFTPIIFFLIYLIYCKKTKVDVWKASDIRFKLDWRIIIIVVSLAVSSVLLISPFITLFNYGLEFIGYKPSESLPYVMDNGLRFVIGIVSMAILPAFCEELIFRGLILKGLQSKFNAHASIILSATMFMLLHGSLQQTIYQFILGIILGYAMYYGKSIVYPMLLHFTNNFIVVLSSFIYTIKGVDVDENPVYSTAWDYIKPVLMLLVAAGIIVGAIYLMRYCSTHSFKFKNKKITDTTTDNKEVGDNLKDNIVEENIVEENIEESDKNSTKNIEINENIEANQNIIESKRLTPSERSYFWTSIGLSIFLWLANTIMQFMGL